MLVTVACVAGGPSLTPADCLKLRDAEIPTIAVNNSWRAAPFCSAVYAADCCWWEEYSNEITIPAERWCGDGFTARRFGINYLSSKIPGSFNSGQRAIELAIHMGATRVLLVGYDCSIRNGVHFHGIHQRIANPTPNGIKSWHKEFALVSLAWPEVDIINCSRHTELTAYPCRRLEDYL